MVRAALVILEDPGSAAKFLSDWKHLVRWDEVVSAVSRQKLERILRSATQESFPGGILPWPRSDKQTIFYAVARTAEEWRRLRPLLIAFAGPTLTSFSGLTSKPNKNWGPESILAEQYFHAFVRLIPEDTLQVRTLVLDGLERLANLLDIAPENTSQLSEPTSKIIGRFYGALADGDQSKGYDLLSRLKNEDRLDALNIAFLSIAMAAALRDWKAILEMPNFAEVISISRPTAVTNAILDAIFESHFSGIKLASEYGERFRLYEPVLRQLLVKPRPALSLSGQRLADIVDENTITASDQLQVDEESELNRVTTIPREMALFSLISAMRTDSPETLFNAVHNVEQLNAADLETLLASSWVNSLWQEALARTGRLTPPRDWIDWLRLLSKPEFTTSLDVARAAIGNWEVGEQLAEPSAIDNFANTLLSVPEGMPSDRLAQSLPVIVSWLRSDARFPRASAVKVYDSIWTLLVLGVRRGQAELESSSALFEALVSVGLPTERYKELLFDALELSGEPGRKTVFWLLGLVEATLDAHCPDADARENFWISSVLRIERFKLNLTPLQRLSVNRLSRSLLIFDKEEADDAESDLTSVAQTLAGRTIAIYTLTESAAKQAYDAFGQMAPEAKVSLYSDYVGSPQLKNAAENADIFVVVTWSAKHAATNFINQHRPSQKTTLYPPGRGATSILRVIDEYIAS